MTHARLLDGTVAVLYGAGPLATAIARTYLAEGATVHVASRSRPSLDALAAELGDDVPLRTAVVDATDEAAVDAHLEEVVRADGQVDVSFCLISRGDVQRPLVDMALADVLGAVDVGVAASFVTARGAARHMRARGGGVILHLNSGSSHGGIPGMGSTCPADAATESLMRSFAAELGPDGIRVHGIWTAGVADTMTDERMAEVRRTGGPTAVEAVAQIADMATLRRAPVSQEVADLAAFLASDRASAMTGSMANATCGLVLR